MQDSVKPFKFNGDAVGYLVVTIVSGIMAYAIVYGWPIAFNFTANWVVENLEVNGRKLKYTSGYGETLKFLVINLLQ